MNEIDLIKKWLNDSSEVNKEKLKKNYYLINENESFYKNNPKAYCYLCAAYTSAIGNFKKTTENWVKKYDDYFKS